MSFYMTQEKLLNCTLGGQINYLRPYKKSPLNLFCFLIIIYFEKKINTQFILIVIFYERIVI